MQLNVASFAGWLEKCCDSGDNVLPCSKILGQQKQQSYIEICYSLVELSTKINWTLFFSGYSVYMCEHV